MAVATSAPQPAGKRPFWVPTGVKFDALPRALQAAIAEVLNPLYEQTVLEAPTALERAAALTHVHLQWLELLEQYDLGRAMAPLVAKGESTSTHREGIARHLRLAGAKERSGKFLLQVQGFKRKKPPNNGPLFGCMS
jgi:hypothetical protein